MWMRKAAGKTHWSERAPPGVVKNASSGLADKFLSSFLQWTFYSLLFLCSLWTLKTLTNIVTRMNNNVCIVKLYFLACMCVHKSPAHGHFRKMTRWNIQVKWRVAVSRDFDNGGKVAAGRVTTIISVLLAPTVHLELWISSRKPVMALITRYCPITYPSFRLLFTIFLFSTCTQFS
jgi:hypothetical protein